MAEAQEVVDRLRDVLVAQDQSLTQDLRDLAASYAELCRAVNERIRRCSQLLRQNLRTEAVHLAEANPNVLDQLTILDFPGRGEWQQLCLHYGLPEAPALDMDSATAINDAYTSVQPIAVLLAKHRLLAMALAPLPMRLVVMREIARLDPNAAFWAADIRLFETARLGEIRKIVASNKADYTTAENLRSELGSGLWSIPVPADLMRDINARVEKFRDEEIRSDMLKLLPELDAAYSAMEEDACQQLLSDCTAALRGRRPEGEIQERMAAVQSWLSGLEHARNQQRDFDNACTALEQFIDTGKPPEIIGQAYNSTTRFSLPISLELEARYKQTMARHRRGAERRRKLIYFTVAASALVLLTSIGLFAFFTFRGHEVRAWDKVIKTATAELTRKGDLPVGQKLLTLVAKQPGYVQAAPIIAADVEQLQTAVTAEKVRAAHYKALYQQAVRLRLGGAQALQLMSAAQAIALRPNEKSQVGQWFRKRHAYDQQQQALRDDAFNRAARHLLDHVDLHLTAGGIRQNPLAAEKTLRQLDGEYKLLAATNGISQNLYAAETASVRAALSRRDAAISNIISDKAAYALILSPPLTVGNYISSLSTYRSAHPDGSYISVVQGFLGKSAALRAVAAWSELQKTWVGSLSNPLRVEAKARVAEIAKYAAKFPKSPFAGTARAYSNYLSQALAATASDGPWLGQFYRVLRNQLLRGLDTLSTSDGKTYFVLPGTAISENTIGRYKTLCFKAVTSADTASQDTVDLPAGVSLTSRNPKRSPQAILSRHLVNMIDAISPGQWNTIGFDEIRLLKSSSANPVVRGLLLLDVISLNKPFLSENVSRTFSSTVRTLHALHLENVNWMDPAKPVSPHITKVVQHAFNRLSGLKAMIGRCQQENQALENAVDFNITALAICRKAPDGCTLRCGLPPANGDRAWVVVGSGTKSRLEKLGVMRSGKWILVPKAESGISDGALAFITGGGE